MRKLLGKLLQNQTRRVVKGVARRPGENRSMRPTTRKIKSALITVIIVYALHVDTRSFTDLTEMTVRETHAVTGKNINKNTPPPSLKNRVLKVKNFEDGKLKPVHTHPMENPVMHHQAVVH